MIEYLSDSMMVIEVWGKQKPPKTKKKVNTKDLMNKQALAKGAAGGNTNTKVNYQQPFLVATVVSSFIILHELYICKIYYLYIIYIRLLVYTHCRQG